MNLTVGIIAGGRGSRYGGVDKGLIIYKGQPMIQVILSQLQLTRESFDFDIVINANRNLQIYKAFGFPVITDNFDNFQGPLAGFHSLLSHITKHNPSSKGSSYEQLLITLPCDAPKLPLNYLAVLKQAYFDNKKYVTVAHDGNRLQPLYSCINSKCLASLLDFLEKGERKIDIWYEQVGYGICDFSNSDFTNFNKPEQMKSLD